MVKEMDNRGQAEAVFRLMIDSIIGLAILIIILGALSYFQDQAIRQSVDDLKYLVQSASSSPDGTLLQSKTDLSFKQDYFVDATTLQGWTGVSAKCFSFQTRAGLAQINTEGTLATIPRTLSTKMYAKCTPSSNAAFCDPKNEPQSAADCCFSCIVSFGKTI